ncbi:hypothetical protein C2I36_12075 [Rhodobacteraceae bacterium WD3A24]|nr:hypothetical protein C2I36_12075 [Rhodobacteraceae bacterium WD3A24]
MADEKIHPVTFEAEAFSTGKMRNEIKVHWHEMDERHDFATDEGAALGGEGTAPPPLAFFVTALAGCLMTNIRMMARSHRITVEAVRVRASAKWLRKIEGRGPHVADTEGFHMDVEIDTDADDAAVAALLRDAQAGCFVEHSLSNPANLTHRLKVADGWIDV